MRNLTNVFICTHFDKDQLNFVQVYTQAPTGLHQVQQGHNDCHNSQQ